jgi:hypothetical protein
MSIILFCLLFKQNCNTAHSGLNRVKSKKRTISVACVCKETVKINKILNGHTATVSSLIIVIDRMKGPDSIVGYHSKVHISKEEQWAYVQLYKGQNGVAES